MRFSGLRRRMARRRTICRIGQILILVEGRFVEEAAYSRNVSLGGAFSTSSFAYMLGVAGL